MAKQISTELVRVGDLTLDGRLIREVKAQDGSAMIAYKHWVVKTKERDYKICNLDEYKKIVVAMNSPDVRFVLIQGDLVNIGQIEGVLKKVEYKNKEFTIIGGEK